MEEREWNPGDVVRLVSGGPPMTVTSLQLSDPLIVSCEWFAGDDLRRDAFDASNIEWVLTPEEEASLHALVPEGTVQ